MRKKEKSSLTTSIISILAACWLLPMLVISIILIYIVSSMLGRQIEKTIVSSTEKAVEICEIKLEEIWTASKSASYSSTIRDSYFQYLEDEDEQKLYNNITYFLNQQYKYDSNMLCTVVFLLDNPEMLYYTYNTYQSNNPSNEGYQRINYFRQNVQQDVIDSSAKLDTGVELILKDGHLYMVRNLVDSSFKPYAMIVIDLYAEEIFSGLNSVWGAKNYQVYLDGEPILQFDKNDETQTKSDEYAVFEAANSISELLDAGIYVKEDSSSYMKLNFYKQSLICAVEISKGSVLNEVTMLRYVLFVVAFFMIPLAGIIFYFFNSKVSKPVRELMESVGHIAQGEYGYQIENEYTSKEFESLKTSMNRMSSELKYQFETIYKEELALKDANIMALQSQINPHFLNNTLEIINWEARMSGNDNVSGMIEALGTMLSATMNRKQRRFVTLAEELSYVDAYLFIIAKRFGGRFKSYKDVDESLLQMEVPMLIIQPIVENAVEHGVGANKKGMVGIKIYSDWDKIIIEVKNDGALSPKDRERINFLLTGDATMENEKHVSLGIRNVNRRLKIIYGDECGLTIDSNDKNETVSTMVVKMIHDGSNGGE